jgi:hypothetical protein
MEGAGTDFANHILANDYYKKLKETQSMSEVSDLVEEMSEEVAKLVLKKFVYGRGETK